jgi:hypothetical protein
MNKILKKTLPSVFTILPFTAPSKSLKKAQKIKVGPKSQEGQKSPEGPKNQRPKNMKFGF